MKCTEAFLWINDDDDDEKAIRSSRKQDFHVNTHINWVMTSLVGVMADILSVLLSSHQGIKNEEDIFYLPPYARGRGTKELGETKQA